jgi:hypothetical protein
MFGKDGWMRWNTFLSARMQIYILDQAMSLFLVCLSFCQTKADIYKMFRYKMSRPHSSFKITPIRI